MWISKKKWQTLEKRIADLEGQVQSQLDVDSEKIKRVIQEYQEKIRRSNFV